MKELNPKSIGNSELRKGAAWKDNTKIREYIAYFSLSSKPEQNARVTNDTKITYFSLNPPTSLRQYNPRARITQATITTRILLCLKFINYLVSRNDFTGYLSGRCDCMPIAGTVELSLG